MEGPLVAQEGTSAYCKHRMYVSMYKYWTLKTDVIVCGVIIIYKLPAVDMVSTAVVSDGCRTV